MLQLSRLATEQSLFGRCLAAVTVCRQIGPVSTATPPPASTRSRSLLLRTAVLLLAAGFAMPALAQTVSFTGISPTSFSAAGQTITFSLSFGNSNAVTTSIAFPNVGMNYPVSNVSCAGLPATPNETVTCTFQYTTQAADVGNPIIQYGSFVATNPNGTTRSGSISNQQIVPYVVPQAVPAASISVAPASVSEDGATNLVYTVTLSQARASATTVNLSTGGTASGTDYSGAVAAVNIAAGATTATVTINPTADTTVEADETVTLGIASGTGYTVGAPASATGTILNDDVEVVVNPTSLPNANFAVAYSQALSGSGGAAPYAFAVTAGALPTGLSLSSGGTLSGTPTASGTFNFTITATDANSVSGSRAYALVVGAPTITLVPATLPNGTVAAAYSQSVSATGGTAPYSYAITAGALPAGLSLSGTGGLSGTPTAGGTFNFTVTATDSSSGPYAGSRAYTLIVAAPSLVLAPAAGTLTADYNVAYSLNVSASGGTGPYSYSLVSGSLPVGISFTSAGLLSGTPTVPGSYPLAIRATDNSTGTGAPYSVTNNYTLEVAAPTIAIDPAVLPNGAVGTAYNTSLSASGGVAPYSHSLLSGALPIGMSFNSAGQFSGTPRSDGNFSLTVQATDANGQTGTQVFNFNIAAPTLAITPATLPAGTTNIAYSQTLSTSGGIAPYSYSIVSGSLPVGVSFTAAGVFSGTPITADSYTATVRSTDDAGYTVDAIYTIVIDAPTIVIDPAVLPDGAVGAAYNTSLSASGGAAPYSFSLLSGALPIGMSFNSAGQLSGIPRSDGSFSLTVQATDANGNTGTQAFTFSIAAPTLAITPATLPAGTTNIAYNQSLATSGGIAPYSYSIVSGSLPIGVSFSSAGVFSGTPTTAGSYTATVRSTDDAGYTVDAVYTIAIDAPTIVIDPATLGAAVVGNAYTATLTANGGAAPYAFTLESGALPPGISLDNAGGLSGTPSASGTFNFDVRATDSNGNSGTRAYALVVAARTLVLGPATLVDGTVGTAYSQNVSASGGIAPYSYVLSSGALPAGLTFANGALSGTPMASGTFIFDITASDSGGGTPATTTRSYTLVIAAATLSLDPAALPAGVAGTAYSQSVSASGGIAPYSYALSSGALPAGLTFANGLLSGTPTASGTFTFDITASDSGGGTPATTTRSYTLVIAAGTLGLDPATLQNGIAGTAYSQSVTATGGIAPYTYALTSGALPAGLTFANGLLSGTPTASGSFTFDITASDSTGGTAATATRTFTLVIAAPVITITPGTLPNGVRGSVYSQALGAGGGTAAYTFALGGGALPAGISLAGDGTLAGTATADGSFNFTVIATDALGFTGSATYVWVIARAAPTVVDDAATTLGGTAISIAVTSNDTGTISSIAITSAPAHGGATINGLEVAYTPEAGFTGTDSFRYTATGPGGTSAPATVTVTVNPLPAAVSRKLTANAGVAVEVDLTEGASGGPFTAATIVSLSPANAGTANVAQVGSGDAARYVLTYTPAATFAGLATVRFTLANAYATSAEATIEFDVTARPDPSQDPEVRALLAAQAASTRRFAIAQINNFQQRLENMHGDAGTGSRFSNGVSFSTDRQCEEQVGRTPGRRCEYEARNAEVSDPAPTPTLSAERADAAAFALWTGGVIRSGNHDGRGGNAGIDFESDGLSVGADYRLNGKFAFGGGLGWGRDDSDVGDHGSRSEGKAYTAALYASYHPGDRIFVDGLMGYQNLSYDLRRYVTGNGALVQGARDGTQWFASLSAGADIRRGEHLQLTPYARLDLARATLDGYTEHGDPLYSLRYADMDVDTTIGNLGLRVDYRRELSWGLFSPQLRLEYQHDFQGNGDATMGYADQLSGPFYRTGLEAFDRNRFVIGIGAQFSTDSGLSTRIEYRGVIGDGEDSDHGLLINIEKRY